ncbi:MULTISPECIES: hypothetical protein [Rhodococcus]|jgi:uncharacterized membrane protein|uniref:hypothetical protein n=1 Tax=Nocardiaceae TaxID=85025 RepID=UPI00070E149D|nr:MULTISPECIES: hypothetical protein [Rhodococcus]KQU35764.1 hypothetical protein ASH04_24125 [Rhodococcus sp. Leaf233]MBP2527404.1 putative membrane protein [Rhodococcus sp. PvP104]WQH31128.1 hypothetical protein U2G91_26580 [Rhodococcus fascians]
MAIHAVGLSVIIIATIASYAFRTEGQTRAARWSLLLLIVGIIITSFGFWSNRNNPSNTFIMTWTVVLTGGMLGLVSAAGAVIYRILRDEPREPRDAGTIVGHDALPPL